MKILFRSYNIDMAGQNVVQNMDSWQEMVADLYSFMIVMMIYGTET